MFINFLAFIVCLLGAMFQAFAGDVGLCIAEIILMLGNLPGTIRYMEKKGWIKGEDPKKENNRREL